MKEKIHSAQIVLSCANLNRTLEFFAGRLGFRVEMIFPADAPQTAVISGYGVILRLENSPENQPESPLTLRLVGDFNENEREIFSPEGVRVILADEQSPIQIPEAAQEFIVSAFGSENSWSEGRAGMLYRDLIPGRLGGRFIASHIRIPDGGDVPDYVHYHKIQFQMIYCVSGWARLVYEDQGEPFVMRAGDCVLQPPEIRHRVLESSAGFEVLEIGCPAIHATYADHALDLPNERLQPERVFGGQRFLHHVAEKAVWNEAQIEKFEYCDTGISEAAGGLADVRVLRAVADSRFSVEHSGEFLFFFVLEGKLKLSGVESEIYELKKGDGFVLPAGKEFFIDAEKGLKAVRVNLPSESKAFREKAF